MPYSGANDVDLPSNVQAMPQAKREQWVAIFNKTYNNCRKDSVGGGAGSAKNCESLAFRIANGSVKKEVGMEKQVPRTEVERAMNHFNISEQEAEEGLASGRLKLPPRGSGKMYEDGEPMMPTTFEEVEALDEAHERAEEVYHLSGQAESLMMNVMRSDIPVEEKPTAIQRIMDGFVSRVQKIKELISGKEEKQVTKTEDGTDFKASDYAVVSDPEKPSTWKLRLAEGSSGNFTVAQVARAITAMQPGGFRGQRVELSSDEKSQAVSRISAAINKTDGDDNQKENLKRRLDKVKELPIKPFMVTKDKEGNMRWLGIPSNKFRDRDNPPQIIEEKAHLNFIKYLETTKEYPVLLSWHTPGTSIGTADFVDYVDGFLVMGGPIDKDKYPEAEKLARKCETEDIGMSHGFVYTYSNAEKEIIGEYKMWEVSHLPLSKAANVWTSIDIITKEVKDMSFNPEKRNYLVGLHGEDVVKALEDKIADTTKDLESLGIEFKDVVEIPEPQDIAVEAAKNVVESESFKEMVSAIHTLAETVKSIKESTDSLTTRVDEVEKTAKEATVKTQKSIDDIVSDAWKAQSSHQPSRDNEGLTGEEKAQDEEINKERVPIDPSFLAAFNEPARPGR